MRGVGLLVLVLVLVAGCSGGGGADRDSSAASPAASSAASPASSSAASPPASPGPAATATTPPPLSRTDLPTLDPTGPPKDPTDNLKPIVTSGTVRISPGCIDLITNSNVIWTLLGAVAKNLTDGDQVKVTGQPAIQFESSCRGSPLSVLTATKI